MLLRRASCVKLARSFCHSASCVFPRRSEAAAGKAGAAAAAGWAPASSSTSTSSNSNRIYRDMQSTQPHPPPQLHDAGSGGKKFTIAVEGCCHGELDNIYATLAHLEAAEGRKVDLLICCGDFQAVRNLDDLETMSVPPKYREIMTFYKYYSGEKVAPVPTLFIGGNHEASNYLWELFYGGWAAPNIYFLGYSGAVRFGGHLIAGLSGTYVAPHYGWGHHEQLPYDERMVKSAYHVRQLHVHRLMQLREPVSVFLSHDWPNLITRYGDASWLFKKKPYFEKEAKRGDLGSPPNQQLLETLQPDYYFAAHLHVKFPAIVRHGCSIQQQQQQHEKEGQAPRQGDIGHGISNRSGSMWAGLEASDASGGRVTRFLSLDKCLPGRDFLQVIELEARGPLQLCYDAEWLAVLRSTHGLMSTGRNAVPLPPNWGGRAGAPEADLAFVRAALDAAGGDAIPHNFVPTAPAYDPRSGQRRGSMPRSSPRNPQTMAILQLLGVEYNLDHAANAAAAAPSWLQRSAGVAAGGGPAYAVPQGLLSAQQPGRPAVNDNPEEINIDSDDADGNQEGDKAGGRSTVIAAATATAVPDANEIALDNDVDGDDKEGQGGEGGQPQDSAGGGGGGGGGADSAQQLDDPMFGRVDTARFPYYTGM